ncbi:hypothetical protein IQ266_19225 [filamentous cyanobacterium LEGE 11480]|uniref:Uncharacterized protein n=1 Tax=Romeriopsis navalis LEGE 11480 TaxID=2777977 RepID=A0A928VSS1_9CYAN|nr:hypothetical protein [Romeriopsis navalis]MBE9031870.1 hypothetical protein [Romeriopsis navalis LEGE 11480]
MIISDLSFVNECTTDEVVGGWKKKKYDFKFTKKIEVDVDIDIKSYVKAKGSQNELYFDLTAFGSKGSGTEVKVDQTSVYDYGYISATEGTILSYAS